MGISAKSKERGDRPSPAPRQELNPRQSDDLTLVLVLPAPRLVGRLAGFAF